MTGSSKDPPQPDSTPQKSSFGLTMPTPENLAKGFEGLQAIVRTKIWTILRQYEPKTIEEQKKLGEGKFNMTPEQMAEMKGLIIDVLIDLYAIMKGESEHWRNILEGIWWKWEEPEEGYVELFQR
jgi:hypothetical protein